LYIYIFPAYRPWFKKKEEKRKKKFKLLILKRNNLVTQPHPYKNTIKQDSLNDTFYTPARIIIKICEPALLHSKTLINITLHLTQFGIHFTIAVSLNKANCTNSIAYSPFNTNRYSFYRNKECNLQFCDLIKDI
jgi:hypothetical protein